MLFKFSKIICPLLIALYALLYPIELFGSKVIYYMFNFISICCSLKAQTLDSMYGYKLLYVSQNAFLPSEKVER